MRCTACAYVHAWPFGTFSQQCPQTSGVLSSPAPRGMQGGELFTFMRKRRRALRESWARFYAAAVICGFQYLGARHMVYRCAPASASLRPRAHETHYIALSAEFTDAYPCCTLLVYWQAGLALHVRRTVRLAARETLPCTVPPLYARSHVSRNSRCAAATSSRRTC